MKPETQLATVPNTQPSTADLIGAVIKSGITADSVSVVERLVALKEREEARNAQREFADAFAALQSEMPKIVASKIVPGKQEGSVRYKYAPYEEIMDAARPVMTKHGFSLRYDQDILDNRVVVTCTLQHRGGHSESNKFACRIGSGPPMSSEAQGDGAATTYAKRFALCAALGITIESDDNDARNEGDGERITKAQAEDFRVRCLATKTDPLKFCQWLAGNDATSFDEIPAIRWADGNAKLKEREAIKR